MITGFIENDVAALCVDRAVAAPRDTFRNVVITGIGAFYRTARIQLGEKRLARCTIATEFRAVAFFARFELRVPAHGNGFTCRSVDSAVGVARKRSCIKR